MLKKITSVGTREELLARARILVPAIHNRANETENLRQVPQASVDELRAAGLNRVLQPASYGGSEAPFGGLASPPVMSSMTKYILLAVSNAS